MKLCLWGAAVFWMASIGAAQTTPVPVEDEPHHHLLLKNEFVEVFHTTLSSGESTLFHTHLHDGAGVALARRTTTEYVQGKSEGVTSTIEAGGIFAPSRASGPVTHRVHNAGSGMMDDIYVELLQRPDHPSPVAAAPVAAENGSARVYSWQLAPGAASPMHTHERPYVIVATTTMQLKMTAPDGQSFTHEVKPGDFHWVDSKVAHSLSNLGTAPGQLVEIELK